MPVTTDAVALNQWLPCAHKEKLNPGESTETLLLGQSIRVSRDADGKYRCHTLNDGIKDKKLEVIERYTLVFTTLSDQPRPLPEISEFDETDRVIANSGSIGVQVCPYRLIENFLDMAHFNFVHTDILGTREDKTDVLPYKVELRKDVDEIWATGCTFYQPAASLAALDAGKEQLTEYDYRVMSPFSVMLYKAVHEDGDLERKDAIVVFIQPLTETRINAYMPMAIVGDPKNTVETLEFQQSIFMQDRFILENQRPALLSLELKADIPTKADVASIQYRRWLKGMGIQFGIRQVES